MQNLFHQPVRNVPAHGIFVESLPVIVERPLIFVERLPVIVERPLIFVERLPVIVERLPVSKKRGR